MPRRGSSDLVPNGGNADSQDKHVVPVFYQSEKDREGDKQSVSMQEMASSGDADASKTSKVPKLPPIASNGEAKVITQENTQDQNHSMKVGIENGGFHGETPGAAPTTPAADVDPDVDENPGPASDAPTAFDPKKPPLAFCSFIVKHHKLAFFLTLSGHIFFFVVTGILVVAGYDLFPLDFEGVPLNVQDHDIYLRMRAWNSRNEDDLLMKANTSAAVVGVRTQTASNLQIFYTGGNVLTKARLEAMQKVEEDFISKPKWSEYCKQDANNISAGCIKPMSLIRLFDGSMNDSLHDPTFSDIPGTLYTAWSMPGLRPTLESLVSKSAVITATEAVSSVTRTFFFMGMPSEGEDLTEDSISDQLDDITDFMVDNFRSELYDLTEDGLAGMTVYFTSYELLFHDIVEQVTYDLLLAGGSFTFIFLFMLFQTSSLFLTGFAIFSILGSFFGTNLLYRIVMDFRYFGIFHVLSVFIILGIGADNIFVFNDTWRATAHEKHANMEERLSACYRRASKSMLITSLTTFIAFISNAFSPLLGVNTFGIFSGVLVMVNFLSAIIFFPTCIIMHHKKWETWTWPCFRPCENSKIYPCAKKDTSKTGHRPNAVVRFFRGPFHRAVTHRIWRWVFICVCTGIAIAFLYYLAEVEISEEGIQLYRDGHNYQKASDLNKNAFKQSLDDKNVKVIVAFGMKNRNLDVCHKTDYKCHGKSVWDDSFDLNPTPAQIALMAFCDRVRNLQGHDDLLLERDPVTNEVKLECFINAMDQYMRDHSTSYNPPLSLPTSEMKYTDFFTNRTDLYNSTVVLGASFYRRFETVKSYWLNGGYQGSFAEDYATYSIMLGESRDTFDTNEILSTPDQYYGTRLRYAGIEISTTLQAGVISYTEGLDIYEAWETFVTEEMTKLPPSVQGFQLTPDDTWHEFKRQEALANSAFQGIIIGICLAFIVLTVATTNIVISILATIIISLVTMTIAGSIAMFGWKISVIESLNLSLVVGLAVDYVVHLSEAYHNSPRTDRVGRVQDMLESMGVSVLSGAFSTLGAAAFMMGAQIQFFIQFGIFMFCTIGFSILYALCLFTPLLGLIGPQNHFGSLVPVVRWIYYKIIGRSKEDETCETCKGKGFHKLTELKDVTSVNENKEETEASVAS